ncbi:uncharacterized protein LOC112509013 [Cynara cardunculus var. scolymus]|uniref:uncharacterized protein LOC112509013 n=1 Tax=Cynara cardunculus var. scolymus TaxID=59895 RepID=UPI000D62A8CA|nr:uncharacterized protein LOC112509013 [Cynara cardunculus var. scolymus]
MIPSIVAQTVEALRQTNVVPPINTESGVQGQEINQSEIHVWLERFNKLKPRIFSSVTNPIDAENWIRYLEKIFKVLGCQEQYKVKLASYKIEDDAHIWWESWTQSNPIAETLTWNQFKEIFFQYCFTTADKDVYIREYTTIQQQKNESIVDYHIRFLRLARFAGITTVTTQHQVDKFKWTLSHRYKTQILNHQFTSVSQVADAARNIDRARQKSYTLKSDSRKKRGRDVRFSSTDIRSPGRLVSGKSSNFRAPVSSQEASSKDSFNTKPPQKCKECGITLRPGSYQRMTAACYRCGQKGHLARDCKQGQKDKVTEKGKQSTTGGWVFALHADKSSAGMVSGTLSLCVISVYVLFDTGATHSIVSNTLEDHLRPFENLTETPLHITTPMGNSVCILSEFVNFPLLIADCVREVNLLPMYMKYFDLIIGMDWLSKHRSTIECDTKRVIFRDLSQPDSIYQEVEPKQGTRVVSSFSIGYFAWQGSEGFFAALQDPDEVPLELRSILVVNEFSNVFPDEIPGLPPLENWISPLT